MIQMSAVLMTRLYLERYSLAQVSFLAEDLRIQFCLFPHSLNPQKKKKSMCDVFGFDFVFSSTWYTLKSHKLATIIDSNSSTYRKKIRKSPPESDGFKFSKRGIVRCPKFMATFHHGHRVCWWP
jgi:hypothetical protein